MGPASTSRTAGRSYKRCEAPGFAAGRQSGLPSAVASCGRSHSAHFVPELASGLRAVLCDHIERHGYRTTLKEFRKSSLISARFGG